jgi:hypothetical protein
VAQLSNPNGFVVNRRKPCGLGAASTPIPLMTWPPRRPGSTLVLRLNQEIVPDFILLFLPPCVPHLISFSHRVHRAEPTCLSTPRRPHKLRPCAPALHLYQRKLSRNLCNTRPRVSPHHVVKHSSHQGATIHQSSDAPVLSCCSDRRKRSWI